MTDTNIPLQAVDNRVVSFLQAQTALTLGTCADNIPYCSACFYAYSAADNVLVFKSSESTSHTQQGLANERVSVSILPDKLITGKVQGIQMAGLFFRPDGELLSSLKKVYYKKYPFALAIGGELWAVKPIWIKFTDNTLGFGKKLIWSAE